MSQLAFDLAPPTLAAARSLRDVGMTRVADKAEREEPGFADRAYAFLERYAANYELINPEDVSEAAYEFGIVPAGDMRAWGGVWLKAVKRGLIERSDVTYQRRYGHATESRLWRSLVAA